MYSNCRLGEYYNKCVLFTVYTTNGHSQVTAATKDGQAVKALKQSCGAPPKQPILMLLMYLCICTFNLSFFLVYLLISPYLSVLWLYIHINIYVCLLSVYTY